MTYHGITAVFLTAILPFAAFDAAAQTYPDKSIRLIVPYGTGGSSDIVSRIVAQRLSEQLGKNIVVENRPGAGGLIGTEVAARSAPDGYTLVIADAVHASTPLVYPKASYHPSKDFAPISLVATTPVMFCVHPSVPAKSVQEFIALARAQPDKLTHGSGGIGAIGHLTAELFKQRTGVKMVNVPYKGGGQSVADAIAGQVSSVFTSATVTVPIVKSGRLRGLAVTSEKRAALVPDIPTFEESGVPNFRVQQWLGILAPAGTPQPIVARLHEEIVKAVQSAPVRERFAAILLDPVTNTPDELRAMIEHDAVTWAKVIKEAGIRAE